MAIVIIQGHKYTPRKGEVDYEKYGLKKARNIRGRDNMWKAHLRVFSYFSQNLCVTMGKSFSFITPGHSIPNNKIQCNELVWK